MNDETLKYYTALQPLFREKMGEWMEGDRYTFDGYLCGPWVIDYTEVPVEKGFKDIIRLPFTIDDQNPERGLLGMFSDFFLIQHGEDGEWSCLFCVKPNRIRTTADTPTLAILKALAEQEGVKI